VLTALLAVFLLPRLSSAGEPPVQLGFHFDLRVREVTLHNLLDFDDDSPPENPKLLKASDAHFFRVRHGLGLDVRLRSGVTLASKFTTEWRKYLQPYEAPRKTEIMLDNLYLDFPRVFWPWVSLRVGRQNIVRGEGFVLLEGGPNDGSRSIYHNAALVTLNLAKGFPGVPLLDAKLELIGIRNPAWDEFIVANGPTEEEKSSGKAKPMQSDDETAFVAYLCGRLGKGPSFEAYYMYKEEEAPEEEDPSLRLNTVGMRICKPGLGGFGITGEFAYQFGSQDGKAWADGSCRTDTTQIANHRSYGGYLRVKRKVPMGIASPTAVLEGILLSGDDPGSADTDEGWYPVFSRWPKWSELYIYTLIAEGEGVAYWSNLKALRLGVELPVFKKLDFTYNYYRLYACQSGSGQGILGSGDFRGTNHQWKLSAKAGSSMGWHFLVERFVPGDFYAQAEGDGGEPDDAFFIRWELTIRK